MVATVAVGKHQVPVRLGHATIVSFAGGEWGRKEAGDFAFWTAVLKKPVVLAADKDWPKRKKTVRKIRGRAYVGLSAGDRFDRMRGAMVAAKDPADRPIYRKMYVNCLGSGANIAYIRPSTVKEVRDWMKSHQKDKRFAKTVRFKGKIFKL